MSVFIEFDRIDADGPQQYREDLRLTPSDGGLDHPVEAKVEAEARKGDLAGEYVVQGKVSYRTSLDCGRCLENLPFADETEFTVRYAPGSGDDLEAVEQEVSAGDLDVDYYTERRLSLDELVAEQIQLALPMKPLCSEACRGLCPRCGARLESEECHCTSEEGDPRWDALRKIRETMK
jgi:uncharacterized protein